MTIIELTAEETRAVVGGATATPSMLALPSSLTAASVYQSASANQVAAPAPMTRKQMQALLQQVQSGFVG